MSCLASLLLGRPTRRAFFNSVSVDSGMSEKSIALSGICLTLLAARLPRADDADRHLSIPHPPNRVDHNQDAALPGGPQPLEPWLMPGVLRVLPVQARDLLIGELVSKCRPGRRASFHVTTNGILLRLDLARFFEQHRIEVQLSYDGISPALMLRIIMTQGGCGWKTAGSRS